MESPSPTASPSPAVPDVVGLSVSEARGEARDLGLMVVVTDREFSAVPRSTVLAQKPRAGSELTGGRLAITIAITPHVPRLVGLSIQEARERLAAQSLRAAVVKKASTEPQGVVLVQRVDPGTAVAPGTQVRLTIVSPHLCGSPLNPWCFSVLSGGSLIYHPPGDLCLWLDCITSFWQSTNGYVIQCADGEFSHSGGVSGSCSYHGGNWRPLYQP